MPNTKKRFRLVIEGEAPTVDAAKRLARKATDGAYRVSGDGGESSWKGTLVFDGEPTDY